MKGAYGPPQDCYFWLVNVKGFDAKERMKIAYSNLDSSRRPVAHDALMPASLPPNDGLSAPADEVEEDFDKENTPGS